MSDTMFEKPKLIEVLETPTVIETPKVEPETPKKVKKPRKPMSEERKEALREQLKGAREIKKNKREASKPKEPEITLEVGGHSIPEPVSKPVKEKKPRQKKVEIPKIDDSIELRRQLDALRASHKANENELLKQQITNQKLKNAKKEKMKPIMEEPKGPGFPELPKSPPSPIAPQKRYSTYKKSVWAEFGV